MRALHISKYLKVFFFLHCKVLRDNTVNISSLKYVVQTPYIGDIKLFSKLVIRAELKASREKCSEVIKQLSQVFTPLYWPNKFIATFVNNRGFHSVVRLLQRNQQVRLHFMMLIFLRNGHKNPPFCQNLTKIQNI